jgi:type II secretory pathway pseudopilin PulG
MRLRGQHGYAMAALLVGLGIMAIMMTVVMPVWKQAAQREKEAELIFRGEQYARAIELYGRKLPGALPPNLDVLVDQRFLRKKYKDPITGGDFDLVSPAAAPGAQRGGQPGAQQPGQPGGQQAGQPATQQPGGSGYGGGQGQVTAPGGGRGGPGGPGGVQGGITAVVSKSKDVSIRLYKGRNHYNEWVFEPVRRAQAPGAGAPGAATPGQRGGPGQQPIGPGGPGGPGPGQGGPPIFSPGGGGQMPPPSPSPGQ